MILDASGKPMPGETPDYEAEFTDSEVSAIRAAIKREQRAYECAEGLRPSDGE